MFEQDQVSFFGGAGEEVFCAGLVVDEVLFGEEAAETFPAVGVIEFLEGFVVDDEQFGVFGGFYVVWAWDAGEETFEGYHEVLLSEEEEVVFFIGFGIDVIEPEEAFDDEGDMFAYMVVVVEEVAFFDMHGFPVGGGKLPVFFGDAGELFERLLQLIHAINVVKM